MRKLCSLALMLICGGFGALAQDERRLDGFREGPPLGCYLRVWSDADLEGSPQQVIKAMRALVHTYDGGPALSDHYMTVDVVVADQGVARAKGMGGARLVSQLSCGAGYKPDFPFCYAHCGGDRMLFPKLSAAGMVFQVDEFDISNGSVCGGATIDLAGGRQTKVAYRLDRVDMRECEGL